MYVCNNKKKIIKQQCVTLLPCQLFGNCKYLCEPCTSHHVIAWADEDMVVTTC